MSPDIADIDLDEKFGFAGKCACASLLIHLPHISIAKELERAQALHKKIQKIQKLREKR